MRATDPASACFRSCGQDPAQGCDTSADPCGAAPEDDINLRRWDPKRRFGIDFLNPTTRYVDGLPRQTVHHQHGDRPEKVVVVDLQK